jgi:hypothetical protein
MAEYDRAFGERLAAVAGDLLADGIEELDAKRAVLYLSLLSVEISLKAMLERAGKPVPEIRKRSHHLAALLSDLDQCRIGAATGTGIQARASQLRGKTLTYRDAESTVGKIIDEAESKGASQYPNAVRYGDVLQHFPPEVIAQMASTIAAFAREHWDDISA